jgi:hypothetical protein
MSPWPNQPPEPMPVGSVRSAFAVDITCPTWLSSIRWPRETMQASKPLNRRLAIALALVGMWLLACIGVFILLHSSDWWFFGLRGHDATTIEQIAGFFMAWTAAQLPAACFAGMIIGSSSFTHPLRVTFLTTAVYYLVFSAIRVFRWPWRSFRGLDQSVPVVAYLVSILSLILFSVFVVWFVPRFHRVFQKYFAH